MRKYLKVFVLCILITGPVGVPCSYNPFVLVGCATYYNAHSEYSKAQSEAIKASSEMVKFEYDKDGKLTKQTIANPMAAWAVTQMAPPKEPMQWVVDGLKTVAWPVAVVLGLGQIRDMSNAKGNTSTNVNGNSNLTGNQAGTGGIGNPVTSTTSTHTSSTTTGNAQ